MAITATLFGLSLGLVTPARAMLAVLLGATGYAAVEHDAERSNDARRLLALAAAIVLAAWAIDVRADDGPVGVAGPVLEAVLGAGLVGAVVVAMAARRLLLARRGRSTSSADRASVVVDAPR